MKNKRIISIFISVLIILTLSVGGSLEVFAATTVFKSSDVTHLATVPNKPDNNENIPDFSVSAMGGLSVGEANNKVFVLKSNSKQTESVLYYYKNVSVNKATNVKRIIFKNTLLGHANAMAIDQKYLYVAKWCAEETVPTGATNDEIIAVKKRNEKNQKHRGTIIKISREAINQMSDGSIVYYKSEETKASTKVNYYNQHNKINGKLVYDQFKFRKDGTSQLYGTDTNQKEAITSITKYRYSENSDGTTTTKFLINYSSNKSKWQHTYTIATVVYNTNTGKVNSQKTSVSTNSQDMFTVNLPKPKTNVAAELTNYTGQDIFYKRGYGLFIAIWHKGNYDEDKKNKYMKTQHNRNSIYQVNIDSRGAGQSYNENDMEVWQLDMHGFKDYYKYELESVAFLPINTDKTKFKLIYTANAAKNTNKTGGAIQDVLGIIKTREVSKF